MAGAKGDESLDSVEHAPTSEGVASGPGVRVERERETTPAPPGASEEWAASTSAHPTYMPAHDITAQAFEASMRQQRTPSLPLDIAVPSRTNVAAPDDLELRAAFVLLHVDGRSTVQEVADLTALPLAEVLAELHGLASRGLIDVIGARPLHPPPQSGDRPSRP